MGQAVHDNSTRLITTMPSFVLMPNFRDGLGVIVTDRHTGHDESDIAKPPSQDGLT